MKSQTKVESRTTSSPEKAIANVPEGEQRQTSVVLGVLLEFLASPEQVDGEISLIHGTLPPQTVVPLHSHSDPEVFYVLEGQLEVYGATGWRTAKTGGTVAIPGNARHALRNPSSEPAITLSRSSMHLSRSRRCKRLGWIERFGEFPKELVQFSFGHGIAPRTDPPRARLRIRLLRSRCRSRRRSYRSSNRIASPETRLQFPYSAPRLSRCMQDSKASACKAGHRECNCSFGLLAPRAIRNSSAALFNILGHSPWQRRRLSWNLSIKRDLCRDPLLDRNGNRMRWTGRIAPEIP